MSRHWPWDVLGIDATADVRAIRRAYAMTLKAGDYETDAEAFENLRQARDQAIWEAENPDQVSHDDDWDEEIDAPLNWDEPADPFGDPVLLPTSPLEASVPTDLPGLPGPKPPSAFDRHIDSLHAALLQPRRSPPSGAETASMLSELNAILDAPEMDDLTTHEETEAWLADALARTSPSSDSLIGPAAEAFNWRARKGQLGVAPAIDYLLQRQDAMQFAEAVQSRRHKHHRAWLELTTPADENSKPNRSVPAKNVHALLTLVRRDYPSLEGQFDDWRVSLWEGKREPAIAPWTWGLLGFLVLVALRMCIAINDSSSPGRLPPIGQYDALTTSAADIETALQQAAPGAPSVEVLRQSNGPLVALLERDWQTSKEADGRKSEFVRSTRRLLEEEINRAPETAPYDLVVDYRRWQRDAARAAQSDYRSCAAILTSRDPLRQAYDGAVAIRRDQMAVRMLARIDGVADAPKADTSFEIPGSIVGATIDKSGLPEARVRAAFELEGNPRDQCVVRAALIDAAIEAPRSVGLKLLRSL